MANLSKLVLPVKNQSTGVVTNQEFDLPSGGGGASDAEDVSYDNTTSGLVADNVQDALDEVDDKADTLKTRLSSYINVDTGKAQFYDGDLNAIPQNLLIITDSSYYGGDRNCPEPNSGWWYILSTVYIDGSSQKYLTQLAWPSNVNESNPRIYIRMGSSSAIGSWLLVTPNIANNLTTTTAGKSLDATQGKILNDIITNSHKVTRITVNTSSWTEDTSSQSGSTLYKKTISLNHVYVTRPAVDIANTGSGLPSLAQQEAYNLLQYATVDGTTLTLYASSIPTTTFYIQVEGVD